MNYHFTTTKAHLEMAGGKVLEIFTDEALKNHQRPPVQGQHRHGQARRDHPQPRPEEHFVRAHGSDDQPDRWPPFSLQNMREVRDITTRNSLLLVIDASLISENAYLIKQREPSYRTRRSATSSAR